MVATWKVLGYISLILGSVGSLFSGSVEAAIEGVIYSVLAGIICFTIAHGLDRLNRITDALESNAEPVTRKPSAPTTASAYASTAPVASASKAKQSGWTCKKCSAVNPSYATYCKECGADK